MRRTILARGAAALVATAGIATLVFVGSTGAHAEHESRALHITRVDGSPVGTLFTDWVMVPGDKVSTTVLARRTGHGASSLLITLGDLDSNRDPASRTAVEEDVVITATANGRQLQSSAAALMKGDVALDLGRSEDRLVPIDVTFELPFSSDNPTQQQNLNLSLVVTAADIPVPAPSPTTPTTPSPEPTTPADPADPADPGDPADPAGPTNPAVTVSPETPFTAAQPGGLETVLPFLPGTGASVRDVLIASAVLTTLGLLLLGGRRKTHETRKPG